MREQAYTPKQIHEAHPAINPKTIRTWANRGHLRTYWITDAGLTVEWADTDDLDEIKRRGDRVHYLGDVLDLAAGDAVRRAEQQAIRARRQAARQEPAA